MAQIPELLVSFALSFSLLIVGMTVHEFSHGLVAYRLGDMTAKNAGRLSLNPLVHIDPVWTLVLPLLLFLSSGGQFVFGAAKPVPVNYRVLRNPKRDMIWIGASGPAANILLAALVTLLLKFIPMPFFARFILMNLIVVNIVLAVFNLIPIPPLDGSRILMGFLPDDLAAAFSRIEPYSFIMLMILIWLGVFSRIVWPAVGFILRILGFGA